MVAIRDDRGAVAVEAALIVPLLLLLLFGIVDTALWLRDVSAVASATRHGARIASAEPRRASMPADVASAVAGSALSPDALDELWVYQAGPTGFPLGTSSLTSCPTRCVRMRWSRSLHRFTPMGGSGWPATAVNACVGDPRSMSVGVYLRVRHVMAFSALLGGSGVRLVGDRAVMKFEPMPARSCGAGLS